MNDNLPYSIFSTFLVRTPLLPFNSFQNLLSNSSRLRETFRDAAKVPMINEALFVAAPEFHAQLQSWIDGGGMDAIEDERILQTLYKYISRMSSRCTPFGLFAGCTTGFVGTQTKVELSEFSEHERHTRLDMLYLCNLASALSRHDTIKPNLRYFPNTSIYKSGEHLRYIEYRYKKDKRTHHLVQVKDSLYINFVLERAKSGGRIHDLSQLLAHEGIPLLQAEDFINRLISNQILVGELDPTITGVEFFDRIQQILEPLEGIDKVNRIFADVKRKFNFIDTQIGNAPALYYDIAADLKQLNIDFDIKYLIQTDVALNAKKSSLSSETMHSVMQGIVAFNKLTDIGGSDNINQFKEAFLRRYDTREVPLLQALDVETGVGYLQGNDGVFSPLVENIILSPKVDDSPKVKWTPVQNFLLNKLLSAVESGSAEINITDDDLLQFKENWDNLPPTFTSLVRIVEAPCEQFPNGRILMENAGGNSAANLLGRFCHGNEKIYRWVSEIVDREQELFPDAIVAEIIHLPESRVGNVVLHPAFRKFEIPVITASSVCSKYTICLDDLFVSIRNGEVCLRSKRLNKRVIPRLSNAHNYSANSIPVYQFLCDLQCQGLRTWLGFNWGILKHNYPFKPRVVYKDLIFSPAEWLVKKDEIEAIMGAHDSPELLANVERWRTQRHISMYVLLEEGDNSLFIDFSNWLSVKTFLSAVKKKGNFMLREFLFNPSNAVVRSNNDMFTNEFVLGFYKQSFGK
ncbi:lantibiotic dehydratase family protein [Williamwhitmania taraxaci]|uniref:Lantibiotic dehydratase, C terminus n=1 Tax=Williamwhitmania taraxaci TaxID=1640674 RepID=A0A1G6TEU5_9BACT|nr:lantibiotic dehydratase family protein [Williamwhitmania taraxaci]SDD27600.1 Lantibiotic dehydratase, C terminus [Williamwhitmania taraxaci]